MATLIFEYTAKFICGSALSSQSDLLKGCIHSRACFRAVSWFVLSLIHSSNSCARVHGSPGISPRDSQRRTTVGDHCTRRQLGALR
jgi:hypothetical protein